MEARRSAKRKDNASGAKRKKSVVTPVRVKLHTELLAEKRKQQREEKEMAQLRHAQLKILGKKTLEDFAQLKLIRRETAATRGRSLHCNGTSSKSSRRGKECVVLALSDPAHESTVGLESRPLMSARLSSPLLISDSLPPRPQSAKPVLQSQHRSALGCAALSLNSNEEEELLDGVCSSTPSPLRGKKRKKDKRISARKSERLTPSKSTPALPDKAERSLNSPTCKKINIIVNMRNLHLSEEQDAEASAALVVAREAWGL